MRRVDPKVQSKVYNFRGIEEMEGKVANMREFDLRNHQAGPPNLRLNHFKVKALIYLLRHPPSVYPAHAEVNSWKFLESPWKSLEFLGSPWKSMEVLGSPWKSFEGLGSSWKFLEVLGSLSKFLEVLLSTWKYLEVFGCF